MISSSFDRILHRGEVFLHINVLIQTFSLKAEKPQDYGRGSRIKRTQQKIPEVFFYLEKGTYRCSPLGCFLSSLSIPAAPMYSTIILRLFPSNSLLGVLLGRRTCEQTRTAV
jgi:hypothetical protein